MNLEAVDPEALPSPVHPRTDVDHLPFEPVSLSSSKAHRPASTLSEHGWISPFGLPPLPNLYRERGQSEILKSPEVHRQRAESGAYYAAAWGSPYATPSPRRSPFPNYLSDQRAAVDVTPAALQSATRLVTARAPVDRERSRSQDLGVLKNRPQLKKELSNPLSERFNRLSESEESDTGATAQEEDETPTRRGYLDSWGLSPLSTVRRAPSRHQIKESLATITPETFNEPRILSEVIAHHPQTLPPSSEETMAEPEPGGADMAEGPPPEVPSRASGTEEEQKIPDIPATMQRPRPASLQSYQRLKKKVMWKGKACVIALPLTDRETAGLPPPLSPQDVQKRITEWISAGYNVNGFELAEDAPDPSEMQAERRMRDYHVRIPDQNEWDAWVNYLKEEKLRALGVSPSISEAPPSTRSPLFSPPLSRVSSGYPGLAASPPVGSPISGSNSFRATSNTFSPSLISSAGISPQPGSVTSSQVNGMPRPLQGHGYKPSVAIPSSYGRITSPFDNTNPFASAPRPNIHSFSSRQNSFSPNQPLQLPNVGDILFPPPRQRSADVRGTNAHVVPEQGRPVQPQLEGQAPAPGHRHQETLHSVLAQQVDGQVRTPEYHEATPPFIEIAHPTPKSHRQNLSMALQREIDAAEAASRDQDVIEGDAPRKESTLDESSHEEPPILRRPETLSAADERSDIETNPSMAATPMLMDDKNPFVNWQALSDAAKAEPKSLAEPGQSTSKLNVEAKEFDPQGGFSSSNFSFGGGAFNGFGLSEPAPAPQTKKPADGSRLSLNADAPAFTPSFLSQTESKETSFSFSSATFNVAAPVFKPSGLLEPNSRDSVASSGGESPNNTNSIFGNVVVDPSSRVSRRTGKPVSNRDPTPENRRQESPKPGDDGNDPDSGSDSDSGRPTVPIERQKRARRHDSDGDRSPVYADSAPFRHTRILSEIVDDVDQNGPTTEAPEKPFDGWAYIPADEAPLDITSEQAPTEKVTDKVDENGGKFTFQTQDDAARFTEARPPFDTDRPLSYGELDEPDVHGEVENHEAESERYIDSPNEVEQKSRSSLSALAKPFESRPPPSGPHAPSSAMMPRQSQGLEASRYATSATPPRSSADFSHSSPPADLYHYAEKDSDTVHDGEEIVEVFEDNSSEEDAEPEQNYQRTDQQTGVLASKEQEVEDGADHSEMIKRHQDEPMPSFEEIDAVMKQFEEDPELGIERNDTPVLSTPLVDMGLGPDLRSDAPSPSPPRTRAVNPPEVESAYSRSLGLGIGVHNLNTGRDNVSDWGDVLPVADQEKLPLRSQFFDGHVNDLVDGILENRLEPLERALQTIQHSLTLMATGSRPKSSGRSVSTEVKNSDADDEDDYDAYEGFASYRTRSPLARRNERKQDQIRAAVAGALAAYQPQQPSFDVTEFNTMLQELRQLAQQTGSQDTQNQLKSIVEDVISHHPRLRGLRLQQDHDQKFKPQIDGLETMLKISKEHAAEEAQLRRKAEDEITELKLRLRIAEEEAAEHRESSEEAQQTLMAFVEEKKSYERLQDEAEAMTLRNTALEKTLEEYRMSSDQWREDIRLEREDKKELKSALQDLQQHLEEQSHSRQSLRGKVERLQAQMTHTVQELHTEQAEWRHKEHELQSKLALMQNELDQEKRQRESVEEELNILDKEHKANLQYKILQEQGRAEISRLDELVAALREDNRALDTKAFNLDRELVHVRNSREAELATATAQLQAELESARTQLERIRTDSEAQISRLQSRLDHAELDIEDQKAQHDALLSETIEAHKDALREANEKRETVLEDQHQNHERKLNDLRDRHTRELHNSFDTRTRIEHHLNERLSLSDDKVKHLENKVADLEERLEITKSAARAAVEAATAKGINPPTPAPSVVASPPQRATSASISFVRGTELPEKISPQALRESIMVLQDQLQNREQKIEKLEAELAAIDKEAPTKVKERDTEISWLRELLNVRVDDLEDIINTVSQPEFDRETVKDAAIRLRANLQMEQQLKERAEVGLTGALPSLSALTSYAQSPRALPMAAAAAWGNWRKARDTSIGALSDLASNLGNQTPSRSTIGSPASFLSGIMTPPGTTQKPPGAAEMPQPPASMRPLAAAAQARKSSSEARKTSLEARPLRAYNSQPRALSSRQREKRTESPQPPTDSSPRDESPHTPIQAKRPSLNLSDDFDEDASPLDGKDTRRLQELEPATEQDGSA
ncbi:hypothetical protein LTR10_019277 [Elasticomyces elasticus]|nr:hypothetical protein LTR10_019277 [Elasticomyces elasticus]